MKPIVVRLRGSEEDLLLVGFCSQYLAVCVKAGGALTTLPIAALVVELGNTDWPLGYAFSRAALGMERVG